MNLETLLAELEFSKHNADILRKEITADYKRMDTLARQAYKGDHFNFPLCRQEPLTRLAAITYLLLGKYDDYQRSGVAEAIIFDTFRDLSLRAGIYQQKNQKIGISDEDVIWFRHIINGEIFKIGCLQYQPFSMIYLDEEELGVPYMNFSERQKALLPTGSPVVNCHIQCGADLSNDAFQESLASAATFFKKQFPKVQYRAFLCYSWLLYPPMLNLLDRNSNIRRFAERFEIIGYCSDPEQAVENLFPNKTVSLQPNATKLQKAACADIKQFGFGCGIIRIQE